MMCNLFFFCVFYPLSYLLCTGPSQFVPHRFNTHTPALLHGIMNLPAISISRPLFIDRSDQEVLLYIITGVILQHPDIDGSSSAPPRIDVVSGLVRPMNIIVISCRAQGVPRGEWSQQSWQRWEGARMNALGASAVTKRTKTGDWWPSSYRYQPF